MDLFRLRRPAAIHPVPARSYLGLPQASRVPRVNQAQLSNSEPHRRSAVWASWRESKSRVIPRNPAPNGQGIDRQQLTDPALGRGKGDRGLEHSLKSRFDTIRRHFIASNELLRINCPLGLLNKGHRAQAPPPTTRDALSGRSGIGLCGDTARSLGDENEIAIGYA